MSMGIDSLDESDPHQGIDRESTKIPQLSCFLIEKQQTSGLGNLRIHTLVTLVK